MKKFITEITGILILLLVPYAACAVTVESIAATVEDRIISVGDVITESKILKIHASSRVSLPVEGAFSRELLEQIINQELVYREAMRAKFESVENNVVDEMLNFERKFSRPEEFPAFLKEEGLVLGDIVEWFHKRQITRGYINEKVSLMSYLGESEIKKYFKENMETFEGRSFEAVENEIRARLLQKKGEVFFEEWLSDLRKRVKIKYLIIPQDQLPD